MFAPGHGAQVFGADSSQVGNFVFGENFLVGFNRNHFIPSLVVARSAQLLQKWISLHKFAIFPSNSSAVSAAYKFFCHSDFANGTNHKL